jgi:hypothetical protein
VPIPARAARITREFIAKTTAARPPGDA